MIGVKLVTVSTHSHPKVAAWLFLLSTANWEFQHTATRRWLPYSPVFTDFFIVFQHTATRRWLPQTRLIFPKYECFNTQPPEGGCVYWNFFKHWSKVSTHSHPKVAAECYALYKRWWLVSTHSHPKVAAYKIIYIRHIFLFQHTATRRWLLLFTQRSGITK